eukprot:scaffold44159_cov68-Cyclotella_meneghiniana.AAC.1
MPITAPTRQRHGKCLQITCFNPRAVMGHHTRSPTTTMPKQNSAFKTLMSKKGQMDTLISALMNLPTGA